MSDGLTHLDEQGRARMVNVGDKKVTHRICVARGRVAMAPETLRRILEGDTPKGDVVATARIAGIQAGKRTAEWIPLAHPMNLDQIVVELEASPQGDALLIQASVEAHAKTGVEMEALVAVSAAGLTIYDMCKAIDRGMRLEDVCLVSKSGGKSGQWVRPDGE